MAPRAKPKKLDENALWNYALRVLGQRAHSAGELKQKLAHRAQSPSVLSATLAKLREYGFTDDAKFSEAFAAVRLQNRGFGRYRVLRDLRSRRVAGRVQGQFEGDVDNLFCFMPSPSPRVATANRAQGSHPQWNFRIKY